MARPLPWLIDGPTPLAFHQILEACLGFFIFRIATALQQEKRLTGSTGHFRWFWMVPVKDILNFAVWAAAFAGNQVKWSGQTYRVLADGKLKRLE
jgi:hypothetical protein